MDISKTQGVVVFEPIETTNEVEIIEKIPSPPREEEVVVIQ